MWNLLVLISKNGGMDVSMHITGEINVANPEDTAEIQKAVKQASKILYDAVQAVSDRRVEERKNRTQNTKINEDGFLKR